MPAFGGAACREAKDPTGNAREPRASLALSASPGPRTEPRGTVAAEAARRCGARGPRVRDAGGPRAAAAAAAVAPAPLRLWPAATPRLAGPPSGRASSCAPRSGPSWPAPATKVVLGVGTAATRGGGARRGLEVRVGAPRTRTPRTKSHPASRVNIRTLSLGFSLPSAVAGCIVWR